MNDVEVTLVSELRTMMWDLLRPEFSGRDVRTRCDASAAASTRIRSVATQLSGARDRTPIDAVVMARLDQLDTYISVYGRHGLAAGVAGELSHAYRDVCVALEERMTWRHVPAPGNRRQHG